MACKIAISWIELILLCLLVLGGMAASVLVEKDVGDRLKPQEPSLSSFQQTENVVSLQAELTNAQAELKVLQEKLAESRFGLRRLSARIETLVASFPRLNGLAYDAPPQVRMEAGVSDRLTKVLLTDMGDVVRNVADKTAALALAQRKATQRFDDARDDFLQQKRWQVLRRSAATTGLLLLATLALVRFAAGLGGKLSGPSVMTWHSATTFAIAAALLTILLGYQTFELAGAAAAGVVVLILLAAVMGGGMDGQAAPTGQGGQPP